MFFTVIYLVSTLSTAEYSNSRRSPFPHLHKTQRFWGHTGASARARMRLRWKRDPGIRATAKQLAQRVSSTVALNREVAPGRLRETLDSERNLIPRTIFGGSPFACRALFEEARLSQARLSKRRSDARGLDSSAIVAGSPRRGHFRVTLATRRGD